MAAMAACSSTKLAVSGLCSLQVSPKGVRSSVKVPAFVRASRIIAQASNDRTAAVSSAVESVLGKNASRAIQHASFVAMNVMLAMPALAEEEKGKIFDFNLTLPIIAVQFLLLMVALDTVWFKPVSEVMDSRDEEIRKKLIGVRDNSGEIKSLQNEAEALVKTARADASRQMNQMKKELAAELDAKLQAYRSRIEGELESALANLEKQKVDTMSSLDSQVNALSDEIIQKVIPFKA